MRRFSSRVLVVWSLAVLVTCKGDDGGAADTDTDSDTDAATSTGMGSADSSTGPDDPCGNGVMDGLEACDDGNEINGDGCNRDCSVSQTQEWVQTYDGGMGADCAEAIAVAPDGTMIVAGFTTGVTLDAWIIKLDADGAPEWLQAVDGPAMDEDRARAAAAFPDGSFVVAGFVSGTEQTGRNIWVRKYDPAGTEVWTHEHSGEEVLGDDLAYGVTVLPGGDVVVAGEVLVGLLDTDMFVRRLDGEGQEVWTYVYGGAAVALDSARAVTAMPEDIGGIAVTGWETAEDGGRRIRVMGIDDTGAEVWAQVHTAGSINGNIGNAVGALSDGQVVASGSERAGDATPDLWAAGYDGDGTETWSYTYLSLGMGSDVGRGVGIGSDDTATIVGSAIQQSGNAAMVVVKFAADGGVQWSDQIVLVGADVVDGYAVSVDPRDDHLLLAGCQGAAGDLASTDLVVVKMTP